jgi:UDP-glucose 4-epimerase
MDYWTLVTGGAGFIGSHVVDCLIDERHKIVVLDDLSGGFLDNVNEKAHFIKGSITDNTLINNLFNEFRFNYVFHLAAYAAEGLSHFIRRFNYTDNLIGSVNLINAAINHDVKCFVFTSSIAVYGAKQVPMKEDMQPLPEDPYGIAKYAVELDLAAANELFGLNYIIFRPHNVYGERQNIGDRYRNVIGIFMNQVLQGMPCTIFGDGSQTRAFTHVVDVAPVIARSIKNPEAYCETFNIGADVPYSVYDLMKAVQHVMKRDTGVVFLEARKEVLHAFSEHDKARKILHYQPSVSLEKGIQKMAAWAMQAGSRMTRKFEGVEIEKNMPANWKE